MADFELTPPFESRYKLTPLLQSKDGKVFFSVWIPPAIRIDGDEDRVQITEQDRGRLDFISFERYGTRDLAWAIAQVNKINYVPDEVLPGRVLVLPKMDRIQQALQKVIRGQ